MADRLVLHCITLVVVIAGAFASAIPVNSTQGIFDTVANTTSDPQVTPVEPLPLCQQNLFTCANRDCAPILKVCDGDLDCSDGSDEVDCDNLSTTFLRQQMETLMTMYSGCVHASLGCSNYISTIHVDATPTEVCLAYNQAAKCYIWETCSYSEADRALMQRIVGQIVQQEAGCSLSNTAKVPFSCVSECTATMLGDFPSCYGCEFYSTCASGVLYDKRPCPSGTYFDDNVKRCEHVSSTCERP